MDARVMERSPFFTQLAALSAHVEANLKVLKKEINQPPGHNPQRYDIGLNRLKNNVQELKELSEGVRENLSSFSKFSGYLRDAKELVEEQIASTEKMEQYLAQYGYAIPTIPEPEDTTAPNTNTPKDSREKAPEKSINSRGTESLVTPELSAPGQMVLQNKELPIISTVKKSMSVMSSQLASKTPTTSRIPSTLETPHSFVLGSSLPKPYMLMEDWLAGREGREESLALTPDVISTRAPQRSQSPPARNETQAERSEEPQETPLQINTPATEQMKAESRERCLAPTDKVTTPTEPLLSEYTTHILTHSTRTNAGCGSSQLDEQGGQLAGAQITISTPEEPVLLSQQNPVMCGYEETGTPEEPVLQFKENQPQGIKQQEVLKEPILTYYDNLPYRMRGPRNDADVPKEPVLLYQQKTSVALSHCTTLRTTKELVPPKIAEPCMNESSETPKTPDLSDMTRSILSLVSDQVPTHPQKDHHEPTNHRDHHLSTHHRNHHGPTHPHRDHHGPTHPRRDHRELSYSHKEDHGISHYHKQHHELPHSNRDHHGSTHHHRDHHEPPSHAHRDPKAPTQPHRELHHLAAPPTHAHKLGQSFSDAMNELNMTVNDENTWLLPRTQQQQQEWSINAPSQREKAVWDKFQAGVDQYRGCGIPPSPQLSDITQKILGQMRR